MIKLLKYCIIMMSIDNVSLTGQAHQLFMKTKNLCNSSCVKM